MNDDPASVPDLAYDRAEELRKSGNHEDAAACEAIGRMWYLIGKVKLGVPLDSDEKAEWNDFLAKNRPTK